MRIVIASQSLLQADAVGNEVMEQFEFLKEQGIETYIYSDNYNLHTSNFISKDSVNFLKDKDTILIYHHTSYWGNGINLLRNSKCKIIVRYHNITPAHFFLPYSFEYFNTCLLGRKQNYELMALNIDLILCNSLFSAGDFIDIGFPKNKIKILEPFHKIHDLDSMKTDVKTSDKLSDGKINVFFIGRMTPNKGHKHILYTAYHYKLLFGNNIRFIIAGGVDQELNRYYKELKLLKYYLRIDDIVKFVGKVSLQELKSYYLGSHVFLLLSEHEGFCVPILEAQYFKCPLIAYSSSAVQDAIGKNQLLYETLDYEVLASSIYTLHSNSDMKEYLIQEGYKNFLKYENSKLKEKFLSYLKE